MKETKKKSEKLYEVNFDINYLVRVKAKDEDEAIEKALKVDLNKADGMSEPHNIEVTEVE